MRVDFFKPPVGKEEAKAVSDVIMSRWMTFGKKTEEFEEKFAEYINAPYVVMLDNATAAIHLACEYALQRLSPDLRQKISVKVPSYTCAATALSAIHAGLNIKFADIELDTFSMSDTKDLSIPVSFAGKYCYTKNPIVEDFAHRIERNCFTGRLQAYSFYATKNLTTGEGGAIACKTKKQADWFKKARLFGNNRAIHERNKMYRSKKNFWWFQSDFLGWKANPTDIMAAMGLVQLKKIDILNEERKRVAERYNEAFELTIDRSPWHLYPILINKRDKFLYYMRDNDVYCSLHFPPLHMMKGFKNYLMVGQELPNSEYAYKHEVSLPLYPFLTVKEQDKVIKLTLDWIKKYDRCQYSH